MEFGIGRQTSGEQTSRGIYVHHGSTTSALASPNPETKFNGLTSGSSNIPVNEVIRGVKVKHTALDVGALGSRTALRRASSQLLWQPEQEGSLSTATEQSEFGKTREKAEGTVSKKGSWRKKSKRPGGTYFWIGLFAIHAMMFFTFVWPGQLSLFDSKSRSLAYAIYPPRDRVDNCKGKRVYMYSLPPEFNTVVHNESRCKFSLIKWMDLCPRFGNGGYGEKLSDKSKPQSDDDGFDYSHWYETDFFMLEMIFHTRLQTYGCLTKDSSQADAFFIPYYTGLHALDYLYEVEDLSPTYEKRKLFGKEVIDWVEKNGGEEWSRYGGRDHFLVMGRTSWDFKLQQMWGTGFSGLPHVANMTSLMLERDIGEENEQAIPYPSSFHASSPKILQQWIEKVRTANRTHLFSYVGAPRTETWSVRSIVSSSCIKAGASVCNFVDCSVVKCSHDPVSIHKNFLQSTFCLQPKGDSATRKSTFDCLVSGAIPVFFHVDSAYTQYSWHLPQQPGTYSVYIDEEELRKGASIQDVLMSYTQDRIDDMRRTIVAIIPNLVYNDYATDPWGPTNRKDAFEISIERVLHRIAAAKIKLTDHSV